MHAIELSTGRVVWRRDLRVDYGVTQDFFGTASTPLIHDGRLIVNVGAPDGPTVAAFDLPTGDEVWRAGTDWGASYASPIPAVVHGEQRVFVFAGGESQPPSGGLLSIDPATGAVDFAFSWRSRTHESVNAACPVIFDNQVFITASYRAGGALITINPDFTHEVAWTTQEFALHYNTPIHRDGYLYGFDGRNMGDASLACVEAATGEIVWREVPEWQETVVQGDRERQLLIGTARGSLLAADGQFLCLGELGHLLWMDLTPAGYREVSRAWLFAGRESWNLPVLSRGLLYVTQNTRDLLTGVLPAPLLLRPAGLARRARRQRSPSTRCVSLSRAPAHDAVHADVALVAGVLEERAVGPAKRHHRGPGGGEVGRILDRELVHHRIGIDAAEALYDVRVFRRAAKAGLRDEVVRLDHQRLGFPVAAGLTRPLPQAEARCVVDRNDPRVVHHLVQNDDVTRRLQDVDVVVVRAGSHRRPRIEAEDAPVGKAPVGVMVGKAVSEVELAEPPRFPMLVGVGDAAVRRIDNERCALVGPSTRFPARTRTRCTREHPLRRATGSQRSAHQSPDRTGRG